MQLYLHKNWTVEKLQLLKKFFQKNINVYLSVVISEYYSCIIISDVNKRQIIIAHHLFQSHYAQPKRKSTIEFLLSTIKFLLKIDFLHPICYEIIFVRFQMRKCNCINICPEGIHCLIKTLKINCETLIIILIIQEKQNLVNNSHRHPLPNIERLITFLMEEGGEEFMSSDKISFLP